MTETAMASMPPTSKNKLAWYVNRLRCMSPSEVVFRVCRATQSKAEKTGLNLVQSVPVPNLTRSSNDFIARLPDAATGRTCMAADRVIAGHYPVFALEGENIFNPMDWNRDPLTGAVAPVTFGKALDYRDEDIVGNIKYLWEPSRHLHIVTLAQAWSLTSDRKYLDAVRDHVVSWLQQCPYPDGVHWTSSLELGIRLINWSIAWQLIGGADSEVFKGEEGRRFKHDWLVSIYRHVHFIKNYYSRFSSANNHLIGEAAGVFIATNTWPYWKQFNSWNAQAKDILEEEASKQVGDDGADKEQAISYQQFVLDFLLLSELSGKVNENGFSVAYVNRLKAMVHFLAAMMDVSGNVPMIGDADDGYAVKLSIEEGFCPYRSLVATGALLFDSPEMKQKAGNLDDKTRSLIRDADSRWNEVDVPEEIPEFRRAFEDAGYYVLGDRLGAEDEVKIIADCGHLGYLELAAHGHADALSFTLSVAGKEFLIDPGTYAYHTEPKWRQYFRGTAAHNTVRIDGLDQSVPGGNFMWLYKAQARCISWEIYNGTDRWAGEHDGYMRLDDPVRHVRNIVYDKTSQYIRIEDELDCSSDHLVERFWHIAENCQVERDGAAFIIENDGVSIRLETDEEDAELTLLRGDNVLPAGWVSRSFDKKEPTYTAILRNRIATRTKLNTHIKIRFKKR